MFSLLRREWKSVVNTFIITPIAIGAGAWCLFELQGWPLYLSCAVLGTICPFLIFYDFMNEERDRFSNALPPDPIADLKNRRMLVGYLWLTRIQFTLTLFIAGYIENDHDVMWFFCTGIGFLFGLVNAWFAERFYYQWKLDCLIASDMAALREDDHALDREREIRRRRDIEGYLREVESMERAIESYKVQLSENGMRKERRIALEANKKNTEDLLRCHRRWLEERRRSNY